MTTCFVDCTDIHEVAEAIVWSVDEWPGDCYAVACAVIEAGIVAGKPQYGHWLGEVNPHCEKFSHRLSFQRHGWILGDDGLIYDYTRWVFECVEPYVWVGENDGTYDLGGNEFRKENENPAPDFDPNQNSYNIGEYFQDETIRAFLFDMHFLPEIISAQQVMWLASLSLMSLGEFAKPIYEWIIDEVKFPGFIPLDNRRHVLGGD